VVKCESKIGYQNGTCSKEIELYTNHTLTITIDVRASRTLILECLLKLVKYIEGGHPHTCSKLLSISWWIIMIRYCAQCPLVRWASGH
jgi:hypothetical protein